MKSDDRSAREFADYFQLMRYSGARKNEAINVECTDVAWDTRQLTLRKIKYSRVRHAGFNQKLEGFAPKEDLDTEKFKNLLKQLQDQLT